MTERQSSPTPSRSVDPGTNYLAPALEKGLDILELLSGEFEGLTQQQIARSLRRSPSEIFRMLSVLERRGYLLRNSDGTYTLSVKLFELSHRHPPIRNLLRESLPVMEDLTRITRQSAHLAIHQQGRILVIAQVDSPEPMGFAVRMGTHYPLRLDRTSAWVLTAFQPEAKRTRMMQEMIRNSQPPMSIESLSDELATIRRRGCYEAPSHTTAGITDVSYPVFDHMNAVVAALTVPFLKQQFVPVTIEDVRDETLRASRIVSQKLGAGLVGRQGEAEPAEGGDGSRDAPEGENGGS